MMLYWLVFTSLITNLCNFCNRQICKKTTINVKHCIPSYSRLPLVFTKRFEFYKFDCVFEKDWHKMCKIYHLDVMLEEITDNILCHLMTTREDSIQNLLDVGATYRGLYRKCQANSILREYTLMTCTRMSWYFDKLNFGCRKQAYIVLWWHCKYLDKVIIL